MFYRISILFLKYWLFSLQVTQIPLSKAIKAAFWRRISSFLQGLRSLSLT